MIILKLLNVSDIFMKLNLYIYIYFLNSMKFYSKLCVIFIIILILYRIMNILKYRKLINILFFAGSYEAKLCPSSATLPRATLYKT